MPMSVTLSDVAKAAGVSLATASRALNGSANRTVSEALRERVLAAAAMLDYFPNSHAQAIARGQTTIVGLILHDVADPYFSAIAAGVMREADKYGLVVTMATTHRDPHLELEYVRMLRGQRARAMVIAGSRFNDHDLHEELSAELARYVATGGRVAAISQHSLPVDTVQVQNRAGARALATELLDRGHREFGILSGPRGLVTSSDRVRGFREAVAARGEPLPRANLVRADFTRDGGYSAMCELLDRGVGITCVFAVNDVMAVGAMAALRDRGIDLPGQMAVAGFGYISTLRDVTPALTTVRLPLRSMGEQALSLTMDEPSDHPRVVRVTGDVVIRESTPERASVMTAI